MWDTMQKIITGPRPQDLLVILLLSFFMIVYSYNHDKTFSERLSARQYVSEGKKREDSEPWQGPWVQAIPYGFLLGWILFACRSFICSPGNLKRVGCKKSSFITVFALLVGGVFLFRIGEWDVKLKNVDSLDWYLTPIVLYTVVSYMMMHYSLNRTSPKLQMLGVVFGGMIATAVVISQLVLTWYEVEHNNKRTNKNWENTFTRIVVCFAMLFLVVSLLVRMGTNYQDKDVVWSGISEPLTGDYMKNSFPAFSAKQSSSETAYGGIDI